MPSMNTEDEMERWREVQSWYRSKGEGGVFSDIRKYRSYGQYSFDATVNPEILKDETWKGLSSRDILALIDGGPWYFGGKLTQRNNKLVQGVVYTD